jgi:hypothetical protein
MPLPPSPSGVNWTVLTNQVDIATNPPAYDGTNFLSLMSGAISNTLPTVAGRKYVLQYAQGSLPVTGFFVANLSDPVSEFDAKGNGSVFAGIPNGVTNPAAVAFDAGGNLYVADDFANTVEKFTPPNTAGTLFLSATNGLIVPDALAVDSSGNIYVANFGPTGFGDGNVQEFTPGGVLMNIIEATNGPAALAFDGSGNLYVADYFGGSDGNGSIEVFPPPYTIGTTYLTITNGLFNPDALAFDGKGNLYVANASGNNVEEFAPQITNIVANLGQSFLSAPSGLAFDGNGSLFVAEQGGKIYEITNGFLFAANDASNYLNSPVGLAYYSNNGNTENTNTANWQSESLNINVSQANMPLVLDASGGGYAVNGGSLVTNAFSGNTVFDEFSLTAVPTDLYYQPEQSLSALAGANPYGNWQLEIQDDRAGDSNNAALVSWELQFIFGNTNAELGRLSGGRAQTNFIGAGGIAWYQITVPGTAKFATNRLKFASAPVNVWFDTNNPPTTNIQFLPDATYPSGTNGSVLLSTPSALPLLPSPNIFDGETYYLGVQNTNSFTINYSVEADFDGTNNVATPTSLRFTSAARKASGIGLQWTAPVAAQVEVQWSDSLTSPMQWTTITNPAATTSNGVSTFTDNGSQTAPLGAHRYYRLVQLPPGFHTRLR